MHGNADSAIDKLARDAVYAAEGHGTVDVRERLAAIQLHYGLSDSEADRRYQSAFAEAHKAYLETLAA
jgi:hypothetical protein